MGLFSRTSGGDPPKIKPPRWAFRGGWDDFVVLLRRAADSHGLTIEDADLAAGLIPLPAPAAFDGWDVRALTERCRDLEPHLWEAAVSASLREAFGPVAKVVAPNPVPASDEPVPPRVIGGERLRMQIVGPRYIGALLDKELVAMRPLGAAWMVLVKAFAGDGELTVRWSDLDAAGIDRDHAFVQVLMNVLAETADSVQTQWLTIDGAVCKVFACDRLYLGGFVFLTHAELPAGTPVVACALTWHHWVLCQLLPGATVATLRRIHDLVAQLAEDCGVAKDSAAWMGTSLWWWPGAGVPQTFELDGPLPEGLSAALAAP